MLLDGPGQDIIANQDSLSDFTNGLVMDGSMDVLLELVDELAGTDRRQRIEIVNHVANRRHDLTRLVARSTFSEHASKSAKQGSKLFPY